MAHRSWLDTHYAWEDWLGIALGALVIVSPLAVEQGVTEAAMLSAMLAGTLIVALSALELVGLRRWQEWLLLFFGFWVAASPSVFGYDHTGDLRTWHLILGLAVMALAALQFWQDRAASDEEMRRHGGRSRWPRLSVSRSISRSPR